MEQMTVRGSADYFSSVLPGWIVQEASGERCLIIREFKVKEDRQVLVALLPNRAAVFRYPDGSPLDMDGFLKYLLLNQAPQMQTIVVYNSEYNCYTWLLSPESIFEPDTLSQITESMAVVISHMTTPPAPAA